MPDLLPFFEWCENADLIVAMRSSLWLFPAIESLVSNYALPEASEALRAALRRERAEPWTTH